MPFNFQTLDAKCSSVDPAELHQEYLVEPEEMTMKKMEREDWEKYPSAEAEAEKVLSWTSVQAAPTYSSAVASHGLPSGAEPNYRSDLGSTEADAVHEIAVQENGRAPTVSRVETASNDSLCRNLLNHSPLFTPYSPETPELSYIASLPQTPLPVELAHTSGASNFHLEFEKLSHCPTPINVTLPTVVLTPNSEFPPLERCKHHEKKLESSAQLQDFDLPSFEDYIHMQRGFFDAPPTPRFDQKATEDTMQPTLVKSTPNSMGLRPPMKRHFGALSLLKSPRAVSGSDKILSLVLPPASPATPLESYFPPIFNVVSRPLNSQEEVASPLRPVI